MLNDLSRMALAISKEHCQGFWFRNDFSFTRQVLGCSDQGATFHLEAVAQLTGTVQFPE